MQAFRTSLKSPDMMDDGSNSNSVVEKLFGIEKVGVIKNNESPDEPE